MSYQRKQEEKRRLKKLYDKSKFLYGMGAYWDEDKNRFIRYSCHNRLTKLYCRRITRKRLKNNYNCYSDCLYKRLYDYWWEIL